jgi:RNA polymerase sigma factor (sigma-70 family)
MSSRGIHDVRDIADARLLEAGDHNDLVESYYGHIVRRCRARTRSEAEALEVAAEVAIRLLEELKRGRQYRVPYRVVVNKVIDWKSKEHYAPKPLKEVELEEHEDSGPDPYSAFESDYDLDVLLEGLPTREHEVAVLRLREGLEPEEIAERLGANRNAVDQAWHRVKQKLKERIDPRGA